MPDWNTVALWAAGIGTVIGSMIGAAWLAITKAMKVAATLPPPVQETKIVTADTVAMAQLATSIEALNMTVTETNNLLRREIAEREFEEEVERRLRERQGK